MEAYGPPALAGVGPEDVRQAFDCLDPEGRGYVTASDLHHFLIVLCEAPLREDVEEMVRMVDQEDGRGRVSFEQFYELVCSRPRRVLPAPGGGGLVEAMVRETSLALR